MAFLVRWENNTLIYEAESPSGEDLVGSFWSADPPGLVVSGFPDSVVRNCGVYNDQYFFSAEILKLSETNFEFGDEIGNFAAIIAALGGDPESFCSGFEVDYTPASLEPEALFRFCYQPWGEGRSYAIDPTQPISMEENYNKCVSDIRTTFSFNLPAASEGLSCGQLDWEDPETGEAYYFDYGYCIHPLKYWDFIAYPTRKYWWPRVDMAASRISKVHSVKIFFRQQASLASGRTL